jgi:Zn-dependent peptidase ImmA (M78 family)
MLKKAKIGAKLYSIDEYSKIEFDNILQIFGSNNFDAKSFILYDQQIIGIRSELHENTKKEYLIHELLHAMLDDSGLSEDKEVEQFIKVLAPRINAFISTQNFLEM